MKIKSCVICGDPFEVGIENGRQKNCSNHKGLKLITCSCCGNNMIVVNGSRRKHCEYCKSKPVNCGVCGTLFSPDANAKRIAKYCSAKCQQHAKYKKAYMPKGYNQLGEKNNAFTTGAAAYRNIAYNTYGKKCNRCESTKHLCVHHIDRNRLNNRVENLEVLCRSCHAKEHELDKNFYT